jgi:sterol desaturase/sphingolipid hydroxylase (fatty acid hydroxylase superfamily)
MRREVGAHAKNQEKSVETTFTGKRNKRGDWKPDKVITYGPVWIWPPKPVALFKWLFGFPGYYLPYGVFYMLFPVVTWLWFTPPLEEMANFHFGWIAYIFIRNAILISLVAGGLHLVLYTMKAQGTDWKYTDKWMARDKPQFMFANQVLDNLFWTFASGVPIWTAYEVVTMWLYANKMIPYVDWREHPIYCVALMALIPAIRDFHFYLIHRLIHWKPLYDAVHRVHHTNVDVGPITGISMHPVEHLLYFSGVLIHWIVPSHPIHALFHLQHAGLTPALGHSGFERIVVHEGVAIKTNDFFHYLHHKYFECNYGGDGPLPLDKWFGTFNDGTDASTEAMNERFIAAARARASNN